MKSFIFLFLFLTSLTVTAGPFETLVASSLVIVKELKNNGIEQVGNLNINTLIKEIETTRWAANTLGFAAGSGEDRVTSVYLVEERKVIVNVMALDHMPDYIYPLQALHEALGANGYNDEDYQLSLSLEHIAATKKIEPGIFSDRFKDLPPKTTSNKVYTNAKSGGTSVGGGGDGTALEFKYQLLRLALNFPELSPALMKKILDARIEPNWNTEVLGKLDINCTPDLIKISIPSLNWYIYGKMGDSGTTQKAQLLASAFNTIRAAYE